MKQSLSAYFQKRHLLVLVLLAAAALLSFAGVTAARYIQYQETGGVAQAPNFYFISDLLREKGADETQAVYYIDPQSKSFTITLSNSADSERHTTKDIVYTVEVTNGSSQAEGSAAGGSYTLAGNTASTAKIVVTPFDDTSPVSVTVTSSKPYVKTLTAQFIPALGNHYSIEDKVGNTAAALTMTCTDDTKEITISLPDEVIPDATNSRVSLTNGSYVFRSPDQGIYTLVLLKKDKSIDLTCESVTFADHISISITKS